MSGMDNSGQNHAPCLRNDNVVERAMLVAEASQANPDNHGGGWGTMRNAKFKQVDSETKIETPQKFRESRINRYSEVSKCGLAR